MRSPKSEKKVLFFSDRSILLFRGSSLSRFSSLSRQFKRLCFTMEHAHALPWRNIVALHTWSYWAITLAMRIAVSVHGNYGRAVMLCTFCTRTVLLGAHVQKISEVHSLWIKKLLAGFELGTYPWKALVLTNKTTHFFLETRKIEEHKATMLKTH